MMKRKAPDPEDECSVATTIDVSGCDLSSAADSVNENNDGFVSLFQRHNFANENDLSSIERLDVSRCRLGPNGIARLLSVLSVSPPPPLPLMPRLRRISLQRNAIGSAGGRAVGNFLSLPHCKLEFIDMSLNDIKAGGGEPTAAEKISDALQINSLLAGLVMEKCALGPEGAAHLAGALAVNKSLSRLELAGNMIGPVGGDVLFRALKANSSLRRLGLRMNRIGGGIDKVDVRSLSEAFVGGCCHITQLDLSYNDLRCSGCAILSKAIMAECSLECLALEKNDIAKDGATSLAGALGVNSTLQKLVLRGNCIGDGGAISLGEMLTHNKALLMLDLSSCSIGNEGGAAIGHGLAHNSTLKELNLDRNSLGSGSDTSIFSVGVSTNKALAALHLSGNGLGVNGDAELWGESIAEALSASPLQRVDLSNNALSDSSIVDAVATSRSSVEYFDISDNDLENISIETQLLLAKRLATTMELDLSFNPLSSPPLGRLASHCALQSYLELLANEKTAVTRIRLMVLGFGGVGKSTFCRAVTDNEHEARDFQGSLIPVEEWGVDRLMDWAERLGTSWSKDAVRLIVDEGVTGRDLTKLVDTSNVGGDESGNIFRPSQMLLNFCSSQYPQIDANTFARAISALIAKGYLSTVGAVKVEGTMDLGKRTCSLVDFAGQVEFLVSHQLLLSSMHTLCMVIQPADSFGKPDHRHFGSWNYWSKFLSSLGDRRCGSLLLAVSKLDKVVNNENYQASTNCTKKEFVHVKGGAFGAISCKSPLMLDYCPDNMIKTVSSIKTALSKSLDEVAHSWWVPSSYEALAGVLQNVAKQKSLTQELPVVTKRELIQEMDFYCEQSPDLAKLKADAQLFQRAINYLEAVGDVMQAGDELLIDPIGWFSAFLANFIKDDLAVSAIQVNTAALRRQRGTVNLEDIVHALKHEYKSPQKHVSQIMTLLCGLELCTPLKMNPQKNMSYLFPCLLPPLESQPELTSCGLVTGINAVRGHRFRESSGFIPPGLFVGVLGRLYQRLESGVMHPTRMWRDHAVLVLNKQATRVILRCDLENATIDVIGVASLNEQLFVGAAKGQASVVLWVAHFIKMFLRSYGQLYFEESWLCPNRSCHGINDDCNAPSAYKGSEFLLMPTKRQHKTRHDCHVEGCWRFLGVGHNLEQMKLRADCLSVCQTCNNKPVFTLRERIA